MLKNNKISKKSLFTEILSSKEFKESKFLKAYTIEGLKEQQITDQEILILLVKNYLTDQQDNLVFNLCSNEQKKSKEIVNLNKEIISLKETLNMIKSSKFFKVWQFYNKIKKTLKIGK